MAVPATTSRGRAEVVDVRKLRPSRAGEHAPPTGERLENGKAKLERGPSQVREDVADVLRRFGWDPRYARRRAVSSASATTPARAGEGQATRKVRELLQLQPAGRREPCPRQDSWKRLDAPVLPGRSGARGRDRPLGAERARYVCRTRPRTPVEGSVRKRRDVRRIGPDRPVHALPAGSRRPAGFAHRRRPRRCPAPVQGLVCAVACVRGRRRTPARRWSGGAVVAGTRTQPLSLWYGGRRGDSERVLICWRPTSCLWLD